MAASAVELNTRGFQFYEGAEPAQSVRVRFNGNYVSGLSQANGKELAVARLEPLLIGGCIRRTMRIASWSSSTRCRPT